MCYNWVFLRFLQEAIGELKIHACTLVQGIVVGEIPECTSEPSTNVIDGV